MEFEKKVELGFSAEAMDYPEDKLQDLLNAVKMRIEQVDLQCLQVDEQNIDIEM